MPKHVALLRGVNVVGRTMVAMSDLRDLLVTMGFADVRSLLQSGNLVFRTDRRLSGASLERMLEAETAKRLGGVSPTYMVRSPAEWKALIDANPFPAAAKRDPSTRSEGQIEGETTVTGLVRRPADRSWFMPSDNAAANEWFSRDPALYAAASGRPADQVAPFLIDANFDASLPGGLPQGGETIVDFPNNHLGYAITWFGLAACCAGVFVAFATGKLRNPVA